MIVPLKLILSLSFYFILAVSSACAKESFEIKRNRMVENQIIARGVTAPHVISAMKKVERHLFVPDEYVKFAYNDTPLSIGYGQTISQPYIVAYMTEILELKPSDRVLEIGTGSGYQAAVLAEIAESVYTIEIVPQLGERAGELLKKLGYKNIEVKIGDGYKGWIEHATFDAIIVTCSPINIPAPLEEQLAEGGRMIIPVGERYVQQLVFLVKKEGKLIRMKVMAVSFVPMVDEKGEIY
ncbi:MAG: protein-L-isoaspartate(D-aspartate) O-methyltransferase [Deltaproteobacteria bacterium]|nr:protein-L-isoaspartate(D-aspartate) O-methyltransferase [Deltaproteobacteria bacterium]